MPYIITLVLVAVVASVLTTSAWRHRTTPGAPAFALLMLTVVIWSLGYALELSSATLPAKLFWTRIEYLGIVILPAAWLAFACHYTGYESWLGRRAIVVLTIEPLVILLLIWTNESHGLFWRTIALAPGDPLFAWRATRGVAYWVHAGYTYLLLLSGTTLLIGVLLRAPQLYRGQAAGILLSALVPWVSNGLYLAGVNPLAPLEPTPFAFLITGVVLAWTVFRFQLLELIPVARHRVIDELAEGMLILDRDNRIVDVNPAACQLLGRAADAVIGQPATTILAGWPAMLVQDWAIGVLQAELAVVEGACPRYFELRSSPLHTRAGRVMGRVIVVHEITARKEVDAAEAARHAAEAANRAKSDFLAQMSHELRTPLNAILGYTQIFKRDRTLTPRQQEGIEIMHQSGEYLLQMINDILDVAKVEAGKLELQSVPVSLPHFLHILTEMVRGRAEQKGLAFTYQLDPTLPKGVYVDEKWLREVLLNLLSNALKYTEAGRVELSVAAISPLGEMGDTARVRFQVTDTGIGIAPEALEAIFTPFYQVSGLSSNIEGTGLGLAISRRLVELMGGELQVKSVPGQGSTFWFDLVLPLAAVEETVLGEASPTQAIVGFKSEPVKILIVDDRLDTWVVLREHMSSLGFTLAEAANGREALDAVSATPPDLILMDLIMPVMDGFEAIRQIRQSHPPEYIPIIAVSARVSGNIREWCKTAGADDFLTKPVQLDDLFTCLETHLKLEWLYEPLPSEEMDRRVESTAHLVLPPAEDLLVLWALAQGGRMTDLEQLVIKISQTDEVYRPFVEQMSRLVDQFEFVEIMTLIDQYLGRRPT